MLKALRAVIGACVAVATALGAAQVSAAVEPSLIEGLEYRLIGPWRGGRVTAVTGVADDPHVYYMGAAGGGVWKTRQRRSNLGEHFRRADPVGTIGAIAVAPIGPERDLCRHRRGADPRGDNQPG
jgi:hypothetical protein